MKELREGEPIIPVMCTVLLGKTLTTKLEGGKLFKVEDIRACLPYANNFLDAGPGLSAPLP